MAYSAFQYEEPYARPRRRINYFAWTVAILLLTGLALAAWLGSFYIFDQPERPDSYRILQRLHKLEPPKRFELTFAPSGEFLNAKQLFDRYVAMGTAELAKMNAELLRNYIRNYQAVRGLVPYVTGRYMTMEARELGPGDVFTSGMVALTGAVDHGELLMEHLYPSDPAALPLMKETLKMGLEIKLERTHDLSAVIHAERLADGRIMITAVPLLYGTYTVTRGPGTFRLDPPFALNLAAGWPLFKEPMRLRAERHYVEYRQQPTGEHGPVPIPGMTPNAPASAANELVRVEPAKPLALPPPPIAQPAAKGDKLAKAAASPKRGKLASKQKAAAQAPSPPPPPPASPAPTIVTKRALPVGPSAAAVAAVSSALPQVASPIPAPSASAPPAVALASPPTIAAAQTASPPPNAAPEQAAGALASTAGGGTWKTFPAGKMPLGRLIGTGDLNDVAERGVTGERVYLRGQFVVNFSDANRAVLRPRAKLTDKVLHLGGGSNTRIIVEFPTGYTPPPPGSVVMRDEARPYEITEVRKTEDGQLNVFAREIMQ
ncbi:MAG TPA: hypothetical protein VFO30_07750 [Chthoniobacterales bacterium]|nr:hypothetical protein [Chthoniobacterales bacterium]